MDCRPIGVNTFVDICVLINFVFLKVNSCVCACVCQGWPMRNLHPRPWIWTSNLVPRRSVATGVLGVQWRLIQRIASWKLQWCWWRIRPGTAPALCGWERFVTVEAQINKEILIFIYLFFYLNFVMFSSNRSSKMQRSSRYQTTRSLSLQASSLPSLRVLLYRMKNWKSLKQLQQQSAAWRTYR